MRTKLTMIAALAGAVAAAAVAMNGCGSSCGPGNCATGCCDANNVCQVATTDHCGKNGLSCSACSVGQTCFLGTCQFAGGNGSGNGSGSGTTTGSSTTGSTTNGSTTTGSTTSGSTTNGSTTGSTTATTGSTTTTTSTNGSTTSTTSTNGSTTGTTGGSFCSGVPTDSNPPINNGGIGNSCTPSSLPDGGTIPQQGTCAAGQVCASIYGQGTPPVCTAACDSSTTAPVPCPGPSGSAHAFCYPTSASGTQGICIAIGHSDGASCPNGLIGQNAEHPSDLTLCVPPCGSASDCNNPGAATTFTCVGGKCHCGSDADCNQGTATGLTCDTSTGACYQACTSSASCRTGACCLQYNGKDFCDFSTR